jgi:hypothetical protein
MVQWITRSTYSGGVVNSGDRGLASPAKQSSIPRSGSFTEVCSLVSEGWTGLGKVGLAGLRRLGLGWPRTCRARANDGELTSGEVRACAEECGRRLSGLYRRGPWRRLAVGATRACSGVHRVRRTRGAFLLPVFHSSPKSQTCESWQISSASLFLAPRDVSHP